MALGAAVAYPQFVRGIVLVGGSVDPAQEKSMRIQDVAAWPVIRTFIPRPLDSCNRELLSLKSGLISLQRRLWRLDVPVIMVHGAKDRGAFLN